MLGEAGEDWGDSRSDTLGPKSSQVGKPTAGDSPALAHTKGLGGTTLHCPLALGDTVQGGVRGTSPEQLWAGDCPGPEPPPQQAPGFALASPQQPPGSMVPAERKHHMQD